MHFAKGGLAADNFLIMTITHKDWVARNDLAAPPQLETWAAKLGISVWLCQLIWSRGFGTPEELEHYLSPGLRRLNPPQAWPGLIPAAKLLTDAMLGGKKTLVWGDYDADGVTSTALVKTVLAWHGFEIEHFLPHRSEHGYGLNPHSISELANKGVEVILTVDCGISDCEAVARAKELGLTVIISDHHLPPEKLPAADAICNPALPGSPFPCLAGVGVAFFLMAEVHKRLSPHTGCKQDIRDVLDFVALGTLADMVPLLDQNRILAKNGMLLLNEARRPGIAALKAVAGYTPSADLGAGQISFSLAPRLNAAGRLSMADDALHLLLSTSAYEANNLAEKLDNLNKERRQMEDNIFNEAMQQAEERLSDPAFVLYMPHWHHGVIGIVASRIMEAFYKPTIIMCQEGDALKGSGRSIKELDLHQAVKECSHLLLRFGGHRQAAGLSLAPDNLERFRQEFCAAVVGHLGPDPIVPKLFYDLEAGFNLTSNAACLEELSLLQPFGVKNSEPVFVSPPLLLKNITPFGANHVALHLCDEAANITLRVKAWRQARHFPATGVGRYIKIAYSARLDSYNGVPGVDIVLRDWRWLA